MCQSQAEGGRRCENQSAYAHARSRLLANKRYHAKQGHDDEVNELDSSLTRLHNAQEQFGDSVTPFTMQVERPTEKLLDDISGEGLTPLIVGGSVRDAFTQKDSKDIDIEVYGGNIDHIAKVLRKKGYRVDEVGKSFGVLKTRLSNGDDIDISVPRTESKSGTGHKEFEVTMNENLTVEEASARRDFTFNAMMYSHEHHALIDPHHGQEDFKEGTLRHVSEAFADDPLRVMRGFQFASRFNMSMAPETVTLSRQLRDEADTLSDERMRTEWGKFYTKGQRPSQGMKILSQTGWDTCYSGLAENNTDTMRKRVDKAYEVTKDQDTTTRSRVMAAVISSHMDEKDSQEFTKRTVSVNKEALTAHKLSRETGSAPTTDAQTRQLARQLSKNGTNIEQWAMFRTARGEDVSGALTRAQKLGVEKAPHEPLLKGGELIGLTDKKPGPWVSKLQSDFIQAQDEGLFSTRDEAITWARAKAHE